jgi:FHS family L-fucose permease-like MFS transporter
MFSSLGQKSARDPAASMRLPPSRGGMFRLNNGASVAVTFALVSSLFLLWGFCNGLIDVMDKHFQDELGLSKAESAWVQFVHYLGYFLMAIPAGR